MRTDSEASRQSRMGGQNWPAAARNLNPLSRFPQGESRGGRVSPHAGSTLSASKKRWHTSMLPAPPTRGLPPPCVSPASPPRSSAITAPGVAGQIHRNSTERPTQRNVYTKYLTLPPLQLGPDKAQRTVCP